VIVDVHQKTTTIEIRILCTPQMDSLGNTVGSHGCLQHLWLSKNLAFVQTSFKERVRASIREDKRGTDLISDALPSPRPRFTGSR